MPITLHNFHRNERDLERKRNQNLVHHDHILLTWKIYRLAHNIIFTKRNTKIHTLLKFTIELLSWHIMGLEPTILVLLRK